MFQADHWYKEDEEGRHRCDKIKYETLLDVTHRGQKDPAPVSKHCENASHLSCRFGCAGTPKQVAAPKGEIANNQIGTGTLVSQNTATPGLL